MWLLQLPHASVRLWIMTSMVGDTSLEGLTEEDTKNFSVRSYLKQLTPVLAEALTAMEKEKYALGHPAFLVSLPTSPHGNP